MILITTIKIESKALFFDFFQNSISYYDNVIFMILESNLFG